MRKTMFEVGVALAAAAVLTAVVIGTESLKPLVRWVIVAVVGVVAFVVAWVATRRITPRERVTTEVGTDNRSEDTMTIEKVRIESADGDSRVGTGNRSGGELRIADVTIGKERKEAE